MHKIECPHCGKLGISAIRFSMTGPANPATCNQCGQKAGVPWWSILFMLPYFGALSLVLMAKPDPIWAFFLGAFGVLAMWLVWVGLVPLKRA